jgi:hypothetical protein
VLPTADSASARKADIDAELSITIAMRCTASFFSQRGATSSQVSSSTISICSQSGIDERSRSKRFPTSDSRRIC